MNRLQKKCFIASVAFHSLLLLVLLFGSALVPAPKEEPSTVLTAVDLSSINDTKTTGGNPNVQVAPPQAEAAPPPQAPIQPPTPPQPKPEPTRVETPKPPEPKTPRAVERDIEPVSHTEAPTRPKTPKITLSADDTKVTKRSTTKTAKPNTSTE